MSIGFRDVDRKLRKAGFRKVSQRGSHVKYVKADDDGTRTVVVPHYREIAIGTLKSIMNQAGILPAEFEAL